ncbi:MAG: hypothetical protein HQ519_14820 [Planctomycetes bacterium]|nr:hypothetical protein [Planctomycetota bacterium]
MKNLLLIPSLLAVFPALALQAGAQQTATPDPCSTPPGAPSFIAPPVSKPGVNPAASGNVLIIESQSANSGHDMDVEWQAVASGMGFTATINSQSTLDTTAFFATADILVISSGVITLSSSGIANIMDFVDAGGQVYLQGEYLPTYNTNIAFANIVNALGGGFSVGSTWSGDLVPMGVSGVLSTTPNSVPSISYHWYGCDGAAGALVTPFMHYQTGNFGWIFDAPSGGRIVHNTDQDWIRVTTSPALVQNILTLLSDTGFRISVTPDPMIGGAVATLSAKDATPGGAVIGAYSLTGTGPTNTPYGFVDLSMPIHALPTMTADAAGNASYSRTLPMAIGVTVWIQAVDVGSGEISNLLTQVIS